MTTTVVESTNPELLQQYRQSPEFRASLSADAEVTAGSNEDVEIDDEGNLGTLHWLLIEDRDTEDNATFRLDEQGVAQFWSTGVEV